MIYTESYRVRWHDTDASRRVRPSALLVFMQETANLQMETLGPSLSQMRDQDHLGFILSKLKLNMYDPLYAFDEIMVDAWTCPSRGYSFQRCFRIRKGEQVIAEATSVWALLDLEKQTFVRREDFTYGFEDDAPLDISLPRRIALPDGLQSLGTRSIRYSDLDYNMHMNNTRYPDMLCDFLPSDLIPRIRSITLSFLREAPMGAAFDVLGKQDDDRFCFRTVNDEGKPCLEAEMTLS